MSQRLLATLVLASLLSPSIASAQEDDPPAAEQPVAVVVAPGTQGVIGAGAATRIVLVNLSRTKDGAVRFFWIYNAEIAAEGASIALRAGESRTIEAPVGELAGRNVAPSTFLLYNNAAVSVAIHKLGD